MDVGSGLRDVGRVLVEEQQQALQRWTEAVEAYTTGWRDVIAGSRGSMEVGRELLDLSVRQAVRSVEGAARVGMSVSQGIVTAAGGPDAGSDAGSPPLDPEPPSDGHDSGPR